MNLDWQKFEYSRYPGDIWVDWDRLNEQYYQSHPMLDSRFVSNLTKHFPVKIDILAGYQENEPVALLLLNSESCLLCRLYDPSQTQVGLMLLPTNAPELYGSIVKSLPRSIIRIDLYKLDQAYHPYLPDRSNIMDIVPHAEDIAIDVNQTFSEYWSERSKNLSQGIRKSISRMKRDFGGYSMRIISHPDDLQQAVRRYGLLESAGWKGSTGTALHPENTQGEFYARIMLDFAKTNQATVIEMYQGNQLIASKLLIHSKELAIMLKTTFDENYKSYGAGRILLYETIKYIFDNSLSSVIDCYTNANRDLARWGGRSRKIYNVSIYCGVKGHIARKLLSMKKRKVITSEK